MKNTHGNALFLILIAVALFAALSYAVTQSGRGGSGIDREQAQIAAAQVTQILGQASADFNRFTLINGFSIEEIDMFVSGETLQGNADSCATNDCNFYHPEGGGANVPLLPSVSSNPAATCTSYITANNEIRPFHMIVSIEGVGSSLPEIILYYCGLDNTVCDYINNGLGVSDISETSITALSIGGLGVGYQSFADEHTNPIEVTTANQISQDPRYSGETTFCATSPNGAVLLHVLKAR